MRRGTRCQAEAGQPAPASGSDDDRPAPAPGRTARARGASQSPARKPSTTTGQRGHDLDRRLDAAAAARVHELRGVHRAEDGERNREEQRVEGALERADEQRRQRELGLEVVGAAGRLPDVLGLLVALVPDLAEQRAPGDLGVRVVDLERRRALARRRRRRRRPWARSASRSRAPTGDAAPPERALARSSSRARASPPASSTRKVRLRCEGAIATIARGVRAGSRGCG